MRCHDFIVYSFQGSRDTGKIARKRSSRALTSRILRSRDCCMAENVQWQQRKKEWSTAPPLPRASLQISFSPALLRLCIAILVSFLFFKMQTEVSVGESQFHPKTLLRERGFSLGVLIASCTANSNLGYKTPKRCVSPLRQRLAVVKWYRINT